MLHFTSALDVPDWKSLLQSAQHIKQNPQLYSNTGKGKTLGMLFFNPSLRTRMSTEKAAY
jgi:N-succinyl-L-ornithine transcarbamylase